MKKFVWGRVIDRLEFNFDGVVLEVIKFHPRKEEGSRILREIDTTRIEYSVEETNHIYASVWEAVIGWMVYKHVGLNQESLANGVCRALDLP